MGEPTDFDLAAASLRAESGDLASDLELLARKLEAALPGRVRIERPRSLLGGRKPLRRLEVELGEERFEVENEGTYAKWRRKTVVHGVSLGTEELSLHAWTDALVHRLAELAETSDLSRCAITRLIGA